MKTRQSGKRKIAANKVPHAKPSKKPLRSITGKFTKVDDNEIFIPPSDDVEPTEIYDSETELAIEKTNKKAEWAINNLIDAITEYPRSMNNKVSVRVTRKPTR